MNIREDWLEGWHRMTKIQSKPLFRWVKMSEQKQKTV